MLGSNWKSKYVANSCNNPNLTLIPLQNGGHCQPIFFEYPHDPSIGHFELANWNSLANEIETSNIDCEWVAQPGVRGVYSETKFQQAKENIAIVQKTTPELGKLMKFVTDKQELASYHHPKALGAVVTDIAARVWPYKLVAHLLENLLVSSSEGKLQGTFNLQTLTPAESLSATPDGQWQISTPRGTITARKIALATNAYTSHLLPDFADLIVPCRGQMSALLPLPSISGPNRLHTSMGFEGDGLDDYLIQRPTEKGGHLMFGGGRTFNKSIGVTDDSTFDETTAAYLRRELVEAFELPEQGESYGNEKVEMQAVAQWTGVMGFSRDEVPWVGPVPGKEGVFVAAGYTGHGMPNTWLSGKAVAEMVGETLAGGDLEAVVEAAREATGLPRAYQVSVERIEKAMKSESVEAKDHAELSRNQRILEAGKSLE
jgi:glycine/D-amino acid oxidase-like deaminating enzyme